MKYTDFTDERIEEILGGAPMTVAERAFLVGDTPRFEESSMRPEDVARLSDAELMRYARGVWCDYAQGQI